MAIVKMFGHEFAVDLVEKLGLDSKGRQLWRAMSRAHTARTVPGTMITVNQSEIIEAAAAEMPPDNTTTTDSTSAASSSSPPLPADITGLASLEAAMAEERKTLPSPAELIAQHRQNTGVSVEPHPTASPEGRPTSRELWGKV